jgi:glycosyltransferase involved in cell wall biosynthesis
MNIGVDIRVLMDEHYSGVSEYTANLLTALLDQDRTDNYKLFYNSFHNLDQKLGGWSRANAQICSTAWPNKIFNYVLQKLSHYPKLDQVLGGADIFWSPHFNFTSLTARPAGPRRILTVHDLSFLRYPQFFSFRKNFWHQALQVKTALRQADRIIAVSENTKNDILELSGVASEKVTVIYPGNNIVKRVVARDEEQAFLLQHGLLSAAAANPAASSSSDQNRLILYLGNIEPRKNIAGLIDAFNILRAKTPAGLKLVLAGADGWKNKKIYAAWKNSPYQDDIKFLGYISQREKEILYNLATVFAYPSFYEGFGFPPLEAMTYGVPVVCSNVSSLPEVVGEAGLLVDPDQPREIAQALELALTDEELRRRLIAKGYERIKHFSWPQAAAQYLQVFNEVYASPD